MWSTQVSVVDGELRIRLLRWPERGPYPQTLADVRVPCRDGETELAMLERGMELLVEEIRWRRFNPG